MPQVVEMASVLSSSCPPNCPPSPSSAAALSHQLNLSSSLNVSHVGEDENFSFTATYLDPGQIDVEGLLSPVRGAQVSTLQSAGQISLASLSQPGSKVNMKVEKFA